MIARLRPQIQSYAWGSHTALAELTGRVGPTDQPEAELWMGAHEKAPSGIDDTTLDRLVAAEPQRVLGDQVAQEFGGRLPFLLKVLAPERALSIQAHPSAVEALDAAPGTYADSWPKPEALVAVTDFEVFAGMRSYADAAAALRSIGDPTLNGLVDAADSAAEPLTALLDGVLELDGPTLAGCVDRLLRACRSADVALEEGQVQAVLRIADQFPGDVGLLVLPLMVHRRLQPGDYVFVPAGVLHAYVRGVCVEILANSDNIVRAGLTEKALDVPELLRIVDTERAMVPRRAGGARVHSFPVDVPHFQLHVVAAGDEPVALPQAPGPRIALALGGTVTVAAGGRQIVLASGESAFLDAESGPATAAGDGTLYLATTGLAPTCAGV